MRRFVPPRECARRYGIPYRSFKREVMTCVPCHTIGSAKLIDSMRVAHHLSKIRGSHSGKDSSMNGDMFDDCATTDRSMSEEWGNGDTNSFPALDTG